MSDNPPFLYDILIMDFARGKPIRIDWGATPGWETEYKSVLDSADQIWLTRKGDPHGKPVAMVANAPDRRWILFTRVFGTTSTKARARIYALGWQTTVKSEDGAFEKNVKCVNWVYPDGSVELNGGEDPRFWRMFLSG